MAQTPSYYRELQQRLNLLSLVEAADGEMTDDVQELFSLHESRVEETTKQLLALRDTLKVQIDGSAQTIALEKQRAIQFVRTLNLLENRLLEAVGTFGPQQVGSRYVAIKTSQSVVYPNPELVPDEYARLKPAVAEQRLPDGVKILSALKKGVVIPGAQLEAHEKLEVK